ncbi:MAG: FecR domain-containing protein, partial [Pseudomonadota bacterium]
SPENAAAWSETNNAFDLAAGLEPRHAEKWRHAPDNRSRSTGRGSSTARRSKGRRFLQVAAAAAAAIVLALAGPDLLILTQADYVTATAEVQEINLPDGTKVHLGADSAMTVDMKAATRRIDLLQGEALFEVTHDQNRPFLVSSGDLLVRVTGTTFHVQASGSVAVGSGSVEVATLSESQTEELKAGDWARLDRGGAMTRGTAPPEDITSWIDGRLIVRNRTIGDVIDDLSRYHRGRIIVTATDLTSRRVTGVYKTGDPIAALRLLADAERVRLREISPWVILITDP